MKKLSTLQLLTISSFTIPLLLICFSATITLLFFSQASDDIFVPKGTSLIFILITTFVLSALLIYTSIKTQGIIRQLERAENRIAVYEECFLIRQQLYEAILAIQTPEAVSRIAVNYIDSLAALESVAVYSYEPEDQIAFLLSSRYRSDPLPDSIPIDNVLGINVLQNGKEFIQDSGNISATQDYILKTPLLSGNKLIGSIDIASRNKYDIEHKIPVIKEVTGPLSIAVQNARLFTSVEKQQHQLRTLSAKLTEMEEAERKNIAIELHDRVGQNLSALNINLTIIKSRMMGGFIEGAEVCIAESFLLIEETTEQIRDIMSDLRPTNLDDHGLVAAIRWYATQRTRRTGLEIEVEGDRAAPRLPPEVEMVFFRIAQEALNNIIKHAKAHAAKVTVEIKNGKIRMMISDDGIGFDTRNINNHRREHSGLGLIAMQERVSALGGKFSIESDIGKGSIITVEV